MLWIEGNYVMLCWYNSMRHEQAMAFSFWLADYYTVRYEDEKCMADIMRNKHKAN